MLIFPPEYALCHTSSKDNQYASMFLPKEAPKIPKALDSPLCWGLPGLQSNLPPEHLLTNDSFQL